MKNYIKEAREILNISQTKLSKVTGLSRVSIMKIENNKTDVKLSNAFKIAKALNTPINELFIGDE